MKKLLAFLGAAALAGAAWAQQQLGPDQLVQKITDEVLAAIKSDKQLAAGDKQKAVKLAEEKVLPYIDFEQATRLAGRNRTEFYRLLERHSLEPGMFKGSHKEKATA